MPTSTARFADFETAFSFLGEPIVAIAPDARIVFVNPAFITAFGGEADALRGRHLNHILADKNDNYAVNAVLAHLAEFGRWNGSLWFNGSEPDADAVMRQVDIDSVHTDASTVRYLIRINQRHMQDDYQAALREMAYQDELTGLANRALFRQILSYELAQAQRQKNQFALLFIDLDGFKQVNDSYGHDAGDMLLCRLAERMTSSLRKSDVVARMGGDEFVVIMNNVQDSDTVATVAEKLIREIQKPVTLGSLSLEVGCSIGISIYPGNGESAEQLLNSADAAMFRAKAQGGSHYFYFTDALNKELQETRVLEQEIAQGIAEKQFSPYFLPIYDTALETVIGLECLARWEHPERGVLSPLAFLPVATKAHLINGVLEQVLDKAFAHYAKWLNTLSVKLPLSINVTSRQFYQQDTFDVLNRLLDKHNLDADGLRIEVTESTLQQNGEVLLEKLGETKRNGLSIHLDDFGTGYSSLKSLQNLPISAIKIDRSFVRNLENNPTDRLITRAMIQLSHSLDIEVVAEGVETEVQKAFLMDNGCHLMQGFLLSEPVAADKVAALFG
ncbi:putative bifunctional diguanylate cyclase/phosphodiesterase [Aestuariibacter salexigens]|uniref:putative bifunctional diguanylate cyclase/phosphodiesterase n=1 Tax=Aestuariibacter salexigens TaxID=226010 RepID=UPI0006890C17|nr:EAL domain-containing protein [Aestuariibacter salexigens]